jgi:hypothetical protein
VTGQAAALSKLDAAVIGCSEVPAHKTSPQGRRCKQKT